MRFAYGGAENEGVGLFDVELRALMRLGGHIRGNADVTGLLNNANQVSGVGVDDEALHADAVILACIGFKASTDLSRHRMGACAKSQHSTE